MWTVRISGGPLLSKSMAVRVGDRIFAFGNELDLEDFEITVLFKVFILNPHTYRWRTVEYESMDYVPRQLYTRHTAVVYGSKVYIYHSQSRLYHMLCFDTETLKWTPVTTTGNIPFLRCGHSACVINNRMYLFGGYNFYRYTNDMNCLNLDTMEWKSVTVNGELPIPRALSTMVAAGDKIYMFGGRSSRDARRRCRCLSYQDIYSQNTYCFDTTTESWIDLKAIGNIPEGRKNHCAWVRNEYMYIFGGHSKNTTGMKLFNDLYRFSFKTNSWGRYTVRGIAPSPRNNMQCVVYDDQVFVIGGKTKNDMFPFDGRSVNIFDDFFVLDYAPSLLIMSIHSVIENNIDYESLPHQIKFYIRNVGIGMSMNNYGISGFR